MASNLRLLLLLAAAYVLLTGNLEPVNLLFAAGIGAVALLLWRPRLRPRDWRNAPLSAWALVRYVALLAVDVIRSGLAVARIVLSRDLPIQPGIIAIPSRCATELGTALSAHAITITPGEMVIEISPDGVMYTHCLDATRSEAKAAEAQCLRVQMLERIFS
jgi:multicomponent Na+:H+ antiporter subunit E